MKNFLKQTRTRIKYLLFMTALLVLFASAGYGLVYSLINGQLFVLLAIVSIGAGAVAIKTLDIIIREYQI